MINMEPREIFKNFLSAVFPSLCVGCKKRIENGIICRPCREKIDIKNGFACPACNRRLPEPRNTCHPQTKFVLAAAASYDNPAVRELIHVLKYQNMKNALLPLTDIVSAYLKKIAYCLPLTTHDSIIIPLPLHRRKESDRGFNQAELIAEALFRVLHEHVVPSPEIETNNLTRFKKTKSQTETKNYEERARNMSGAFSLKKPERVVGKNIILVDDVSTSGATMREAVKVLKDAGARKIIGFVIAKA